jgi:hypothetical protein
MEDTGIKYNVTFITDQKGILVSHQEINKTRTRCSIKHNMPISTNSNIHILSRSTM